MKSYHILPIPHPALISADRRIEDRATYCAIEYTPWIRYDALTCQKNLTSDGWQHVATHRAIEERIRLVTTGRAIASRINTKSERLRVEWRAQVLADCLASWTDLQATTRREWIAAGQRLQREQIDALRAVNAAHVVSTRNAAKARREIEQIALAAGRFWECSEATLKDFFSVPFSCRKLVSISERFRAALFVELEVGDRHGYRALVPTDSAYLCGVDDNGEQWGHRIESWYWSYDSTVEEAMARLWNVSVTTVGESHRQGEILIHPEPFPPGVTLRPNGGCCSRWERCRDGSAPETYS